MTPARKLLTDQMLRRLISARVAKGIDQGDLADALKVTWAYVSMLERGAAQPSVKVLDRWCEALGLELEVSIKNKN
jgi:transcriptional regulator with XRE-family HTH domain